MLVFQKSLIKYSSPFSERGKKHVEGFRGLSLAPDGDMDLRDAIQRIALELPRYGRPKITAELHPA